MLTTRQRTDDGGAVLLWASLLGAVLGALAVLALGANASGAADLAHTATGSANVAQIVQAARVQQVVAGGTLHDQLLAVTAQCDCGVAVDPTRDVLTYRNGNSLVSVDVDSGARSTAPAGDTTLPEFSRPAPQLTIDLGGR